MGQHGPSVSSGLRYVDEGSASMTSLGACTLRGETSSVSYQVFWLKPSVISFHLLA